ncbi:hypothetical protein BU204_30470 [Actinophytocola xanthii]|uniref:Uncharacterized protein n=1 Tax=Actinophytocola xanthii TaxID=1912961 RepID=A0A1Q8CAE0_9PSEU|nr:hypothetical protein BU204_30470 [Actinophytocola xanthii]
MHHGEFGQQFSVVGMVLTGRRSRSLGMCERVLEVLGRSSDAISAQQVEGEVGLERDGVVALENAVVHGVDSRGNRRIEIAKVTLAFVPVIVPGREEGEQYPPIGIVHAGDGEALFGAADLFTGFAGLLINVSEPGEQDRRLSGQVQCRLTRRGSEFEVGVRSTRFVEVDDVEQCQFGQRGTALGSIGWQQRQASLERIERCLQVTERLLPVEPGTESITQDEVKPPEPRVVR